MENNNKRKEAIRAIKFALFSVSAGIIEIAEFTLLDTLTDWKYWPCYLIALICSVVWNFTLNRKYTFKSAANVPIAMLKVALFYAVFTPVSTWLEHWYTTGLGWNEYVATILNMLLNFVTEFLYQRFFVFGKSIDTNAGASADNSESADAVLTEAGKAADTAGSIAENKKI